ncbi:MAG TPA: hypothetical protein VMX79_10145 [bacterium]|nr:hypothetical protein [bacterium]
MKLSQKAKEIWTEFAEAEAAAAKILDKAVVQARHAEKLALTPVKAAFDEEHRVANDEFNKLTKKAYEIQTRIVNRAYETYNKAVAPARQNHDAALDLIRKEYDRARDEAIKAKTAILQIAQEEYRLARDKAAKKRDAALKQLK